MPNIDFNLFQISTVCSFKEADRMKSPVTSPNLATLIRFHRKQAGLSQVELAAMADVSRKVIQELEAGHDTVTWRKLLAVLEILNVKLNPAGPLVEQWKLASNETDESEP